MTKIILLHHLGLGDHLICNGMVREYCKTHDRVAIFSYPKNYTSVSFMFRDVPNLEVMRGDEAFALLFMLNNKFKREYNETKNVGLPHLDMFDSEPMERQFYRLAGLDFAKKWESFHIERDQSREQALFSKMKPKGDYIFLHDDAARGLAIDHKKVPEHYAVVSPASGLTDNIFDFCSLIEKAKEIHLIESSFMYLVDLLPYTNPEQKLVIHRYARPNPVWSLPALKKNWEIIN
ncbi:hypothetical protein M1413_04245 [Patescibacteria group bacterium]|nr:hypothetical protein [Patescibacteria group bacterium]